MTNFNSEAIGKSKTKLIVFKLAIILMGMLLTGVGTSIMYAAGLGSAPPGTINEGVKEFLGIGFGTAGIIVNSTFIVLLFAVDKSLIGVGTVAMLFFGFFVDLGNVMIAPFNLASATGITQILISLFGCTIVAIGTGLYLGINWGSGAIDGISLLLDSKLPIDLKYCRWITDILLVVVGALLGASWGLGTIFAVIVTAPIMKSIMVAMRKHF